MNDNSTTPTPRAHASSNRKPRRRRKKRPAAPHLPLTDAEYDDLRVMRFSEFSARDQARFNEQCMEDRPPPRWLVLELCMLPSRAFAEWYWRRGLDPDKQRDPIPQWLRAHVFQRDDKACRYCSATLTLRTMHVDHVVPVSRGGDNDSSNLVAACVRCNLSKGAKILEEWLS